MRTELKAGKTCISIDTFGAEVKSIWHGNRDYLWNGDPKLWNRCSPVLFPFVGSLVEQKYRYKGKTYPMCGHGFARDREFRLVEQDDTRAVYELLSDAESLQNYPFPFRLLIHYELEEGKLTVSWDVENTSDQPMYFSIGAHPALLCEVDEQGRLNGNYLKFEKKGKYIAPAFEAGLVYPDETHELQTDDEGFYPLDEHSFDHNVHILEHGQVQSVALANKDKKVYVKVDFEAPLVGIWSPPKKNAPFVCIEPWYGRSDAADFDGELPEREYEQKLDGGKTFHAGYSMQFFDL